MAVMSSAIREYPQKHSISAEEYLRMGEAGVFAPDARLELIEGEIIEMAPIGPPHLSRVNMLTRFFVQRVGANAIVSVQNSLALAERSVPQPDLALLRPRKDEYSTALPRPADVLLMVEVADTTLRFDVGTKVPLYARCGIVETWVVDVNERCIHVFREPQAAGYSASFIARDGERVSCLSLPQLVIEVAEIFPA
jgi:Uma2 family endonuclease